MQSDISTLTSGTTIPGDGLFKQAHDFVIQNSSFTDVHNNYVRSILLFVKGLIFSEAGQPHYCPRSLHQCADASSSTSQTA